MMHAFRLGPGEDSNGHPVRNDAEGKTQKGGRQTEKDGRVAAGRVAWHPLDCAPNLARVYASH